MTPERWNAMLSDWKKVQPTKFSQQSDHTPAPEFQAAWQIQQEKIERLRLFVASVPKCRVSEDLKRRAKRALE